jgi:hypothetical protein
LTSDLSGTVNGETVDFSAGFTGSPDFTGGALNFNYENYLRLNGLTTDLLRGDFTVAFKVFQTGTGRTAYFAAQDDCYIGIDDIHGNYNIGAVNSGWNILQADSRGYDDSGNGSIARRYNEEVSLAYVHEGTSWRLYVNGVLSVQKNRSGDVGAGNTLRLGKWGGNQMEFIGKLWDFKLYREALPETLIRQL